MRSLLVLVVMGCSCMAQATLTTVSAANYSAIVAPGSIVSIFGSSLATGVFVSNNTSPNPLPTVLGGVSIIISDASGNATFVPLISVSQNQVNAVLPSEMKVGAATLNLTTSNGGHISGKVNLEAVSPGLFTADQSGGWLAAAQVVIAHADGTQTFIPYVATCGATLAWNGMTWSDCVPTPISLGLSTDKAVLELYGTGIRGANSLAQNGYAAVSVYEGRSCGSLCSTDYLPVLYSGPQAAGAPSSFYGLDQINIMLPNYLVGSGVIALTVTALSGYYNGQGVGSDANTVYVDIK